eukprot:CAMPEP_0185585170 /NCGR_PEP_ID=MMETSP0434-20130131/36990_1 /TAXON_ID=626734 ORGANISM="Favella taraikaensis, Strain Fe Narragansett Bay" /NCGR_SAMPLE_ID=MMETSP0434 /ASSEMBLY_ACC=CAM_ASM_000379 /LENGTH=175 /DNA_ID=CAMNT_0028205339 /DNA_START=626 /DNA_END=1153 /DNA_ORIENTATION=-
MTGTEPPESPLGFSRAGSPTKFNESMRDDGESPPDSPMSIHKRKRDRTPTPEQSPMPSEPKRKKPVSKFNADLPEDPDSARDSKARVSKRSSRVRKDGTKSLLLEPIQVKPIDDEDESEANDMIQESLAEDDEEVADREGAKVNTESEDQAASPRLEAKGKMKSKASLSKNEVSE